MNPQEFLFQIFRPVSTYFSRTFPSYLISLKSYEPVFSLFSSVNVTTADRWEQLQNSIETKSYGIYSLRILLINADFLVAS